MSIRKCRLRVVAVGWLVLVACASAASAAPFPDPSLFGEPTPVPGIPGGLPNGVCGATLTPDGQTMVFCWFTGTWQLYTAQWDAQQKSWGDIRHLPGASWYDMLPTLSGDGKWLFYHGYEGGLYVAERQPSGTWGNSRQIPVDVTTNGANANPFFDGSTLYFDRRTDVRDRGGYVWDVMYEAPYDPIRNVCGSPARVDSVYIGYPTSSGGARIFGDGKTLLFSRGPSDGTWPEIYMGKWDLFLREWVDIAALGAPVNTGAGESSPWYCEQTRTLYFVRSDYRLYQSVVIEDTTPPVARCTTDKSVLWPPNHQIEQVTVYVQASDNVTTVDQLRVSATVSSNEPDDALGDGHFVGDVNGQNGYAQAVPFNLTYDADLGCFVGTLSLRAERDGAASGRVYPIECTVTDLAGNVTTTSCVVTVPHDQRKK